MKSPVEEVEFENPELDDVKLPNNRIKNLPKLPSDLYELDLSNNVWLGLDKKINVEVFSKLTGLRLFRIGSTAIAGSLKFLQESWY
ncbi:MAG: hypothetical protein I3270_00305 [Candidatus Moeniiplasma glomeromycotorum]|nr:hypothetical protein [Candidatus Moeniiplasma glomeromycotorum]MCE8162263.1 hypothetical protein [Candidatus Moeniiplasma glomeromycotorum]MCE8166081.1 hypothetical protein [Candidatus Moeniiplasma glomeromycotorum]MCE8166662.1 hypothetical protein [Candidatus Moeniiplasma glomeromycotorum]